jgi:hypothetical protein
VLVDVDVDFLRGELDCWPLFGEFSWYMEFEIAVGLGVAAS